VRMRGNCTPVVVQCAEYLLVTAFADARTHQDDQISATEQRLLQAETFTNQALYPVTPDRVARRLYRDHCAKPRMIQAVSGREYGDQAVTGLVLAMFEHPLVLGRREQSATAWITRRH